MKDLIFIKNYISVIQYNGSVLKIFDKIDNYFILNTNNYEILQTKNNLFLKGQFNSYKNTNYLFLFFTLFKKFNKFFF